MKRYFEFACMALGVPTVYVPLLAIMALGVLACCCSCTSEETIDRINGLPSDDAINKRYEQLTEALNQ